MPARITLVGFLKKPQKNKGNNKPIFTINVLPIFIKNTNCTVGA
jgi:hypothetical protein